MFILYLSVELIRLFNFVILNNTLRARSIVIQERKIAIGTRMDIANHNGDSQRDLQSKMSDHNILLKYTLSWMR